MSKKFIVTGTDTDVGKTVFSAALMQAIEAMYWKPIQSGVQDGVDTKRIQKLTQLPQDRFLPESYVFSEPLSPHLAAEIDNEKIDISTMGIPDVNMPLIIEGAGGLMVPISRENLLINLIKKWNLPVILCARTALGTINHTLLSLEALWARGILIHGIAFIGDENEDNMKTVQQFSQEKILGRLPFLKDLNAENLQKAFKENFDQKDFL